MHRRHVARVHQTSRVCLQRGLFLPSWNGQAHGRPSLPCGLHVSGALSRSVGCGAESTAHHSLSLFSLFSLALTGVILCWLAVFMSGRTILQSLTTRALQATRVLRGVHHSITVSIWTSDQKGARLSSFVHRAPPPFPMVAIQKRGRPTPPLRYALAASRAKMVPLRTTPKTIRAVQVTRARRERR